MLEFVKIVLGIILCCGILVTILLENIIKVLQLIVMTILLGIDSILSDMIVVPKQMCLSFSKFIDKLGSKKETVSVDNKKEEV